MAWQTAFLFGLSLPPALLGFVFGGTVASYNFHWFLSLPRTEAATPKMRWTMQYKVVHFCLSLLGGAAAFFFFLRLQDLWLPLLFPSVLAFLYSAPKIRHPLFIWLRRFAVGKTFFLSAAWTYVTAILPLVSSLDEWTRAEVIFIANRFFFIYALCVLFDYRDRAEDQEEGIRSLVTFLSDRGVDRLFWSTWSIGIGTTGILGYWFPPAQLIALFIPQLLLGLLYNSSKRTDNDLRYYFVLDGLMMLSAPLLIFAKFVR